MAGRKIELMHGATPLYLLPNMSDELGVDVYIKRDDMTAVGLGGNKIRNLEYLLGEAVAGGHKVVVTAASVRSNYLRIFTACCNKLGLKPVVFIRGGEPAEPPSGNLLCVLLLGGEVHYVETEDPFDDKILNAMYSYDPDAYVIHLGLHSGPVAAMGYIDAMQEMKAQFDTLGICPKAIYTAVGSGCTYAGLWAGAKLYAPMKVVGISVNLEPDFLQKLITEDIEKASAAVGSPLPVPQEELDIRGHLRHPGYGKVNAQCMDAIQKVGRWEGILLDPVYTAKPAAAIIEDAGQYQKGDSVVLLHTGGSPNIFAAGAQMLAYI